MEYIAKEFNIPVVPGLSNKQLEVHLGLYKGYVTHVNKLRSQLQELEANGDDFSYAVTETRRRLGFEFNGMRMHEYYFEQMEQGPSTVDQSSPLVIALEEKYGSWEKFMEHFKKVAMSRGIGWTILYWDERGETPHVAWVSDHELGTLAGLAIIFAMDMWEHAFMVDYTPTEKMAYIQAYLDAVNWNVPMERFSRVMAS